MVNIDKTYCYEFVEILTDLMLRNKFCLNII